MFNPLNKKGLVLVLFLSIFVVMIIMPMLFIRIGFKTEKFETVIGSLQTDVLQAHNKLDHIQMYIDKAAEHTSHQVIHQLALKPGSEDCTKSGDIIILDPTNPLCVPDNLDAYKESFKREFREVFNKYLIEISLDLEYKLFFQENNEIIIQFDEPLSAKIRNYGVTQIIPYTKFKSLYQIKEYGLILTKLRSSNPGSLNECNQLPDLKNCLELRLTEFNKDRTLLWSLGEIENRLATFDVQSNTKLYHFDGKSTTLKPVTYKFALEFPNPKSQP